MDEAIHLNNIGARYAETGDFEQAIANFSEALRIETIQTEWREMHIAEEETRTMPETGNLDMFMTKAPDESYDNGYVYDKCIKIPISANDGTHFQDLTSVTVLFNLAVAHQLLAMRSDDGAAPAILEKAINFYEFAFEVQQQARTSSPHFTMVTVNNLGHAHRMLGNKEKSRQCFDQLLSTLMFLIDSQHVDAASIQGFFRNVSQNIFADCAVAAAAA